MINNVGAGVCLTGAHDAMLGSENFRPSLLPLLNQVCLTGAHNAAMIAQGLQPVQVAAMKTNNQVVATTSNDGRECKADYLCLLPPAAKKGNNTPWCNCDWCKS